MKVWRVGVLIGWGVAWVGCSLFEGGSPDAVEKKGAEKRGGDDDEDKDEDEDDNDDDDDKDDDDGKGKKKKKGGKSDGGKDVELRRFSCTFKEVEGAGQEREAIFTIKNLGKEASKSEQTWVFYYDKEGVQQKEYPHAIGDELGPGKSVTLALGYTGADLSPDFKDIECEVTNATLADDSLWINDNLKAPAFEKRPKGGFDAAYLKDRASVRVKATFKPKQSAGVVHLENDTGRPLTVRLLRIHTFDAKEAFVEEHLDNVSIDLDGKGEIDHDISHGVSGDVKFVDVYVASFTYKDGKQEAWENQNLSATFNTNMKKRQKKKKGD